ncbi:response regulator [bacterium]|nr:response regulator [bacterium]
MNELNSKRIVLIEDDPDFLNMLTIRLEVNGFKVSATAGALEGLRLVQEQMPDLVILDLRMPGFETSGSTGTTLVDRHMGLKICRMIKFDTRLHHIPVLMLTASDSFEDIEQAVHSGANAYLMKTDVMEFLIKEVERMSGLKSNGIQQAKADGMNSEKHIQAGKLSFEIFK